MAEALLKVLKEWGIKDKIISITCDNASANTKMIEELQALLPSFPGPRAHIRCYAHTINLTAKAVLRPFEPNTKGTDGSDPDDKGREELAAELIDLEENGVQEEDDDEGVVNVVAGMSEGEKEQWDAAVAPIRNTLFKTRRVSFKVINSPTILLPAWRKVTVNTCFELRTLPRDVLTCWNSTYDMLCAYLEMKTQVTQFLDSNANGLAAFNLNEDKWTAVEDLVTVLKILKDATNFFSADNASLSAVIPAMDVLDQSFATGIIKERVLSEPLRYALSIGKKTMNRYYGLTDDSHLYRMAMILDPAYKLNYFHHLKWSKEWIDTAVAITREAWERFKPEEISSDESERMNIAGPSQKAVNEFASIISTHRNCSQASGRADELERYLADSTVPTDNPLNWWIANQTLYPNLSKLAMSVHCSMSSTVLMCFGDWSRLDFFTNDQLEAILERDDSITKSSKDLGGPSFVDLL